MTGSLAAVGLNLADLPEMPPAALDPVLDAAATCFARYGIRRTSVQDVATELGVNRTTVYRQVGTVEQMALLLSVREAYRALSGLVFSASWKDGAPALVELLASAIEVARQHPVFAKVLADEPDMIASMTVEQLPARMGRAVDVLSPFLQTLMDNGQLTPREPAIIAEWLLRIGASLIVQPAAVPIRDFLNEILLPVLDPAHRGG